MGCLEKIIRIYQLFLSPWLGGVCRFYPSCSEYAKQVLRNNRGWKGLYFSFRRILKCHPFHPGGIDFPEFRSIVQPMGVVRVERQDAPPDFSERGFTPRERKDLP